VFYNRPFYCFYARSQNCEKRLLALSCLPVCPHGTSGLPPDRFWWNLIFVYFLKNCPDNSNFIKSGQEWWVLYMKTTRHFFAHFFLEWEMCKTKVVDEIKTHILCLITFFFNRSIYEIIWKNIVELGGSQMTVCYVHIACWITKTTNTHSEYVILPLHWNSGCK